MIFLAKQNSNNFHESLSEIEELVRDSKNGVLIDIEITPNAKKNQIGGINTWRKRLEIRIKEQPIEGKANKEIIKFLKKTLKKNIEIVAGSTSSQKTVLVVDAKKEEVIEILKDIIFK
ncbi:MAG: uncharacterized protein PWP15_9 [Methanothermococcus sp.]|nr:uncharacterized protein [Methanothermococcus sp.]MDK2988160.1 uncharacterized protein [Methanothermococcus sp.]